MKWLPDNNIKKSIQELVRLGDFGYIKGSQITVYRSYGSTSRAIARIWGLPRVWQQALKIKPHYIIEVISERFDKLNTENQIKTLIHELLHIPKGFSGALVPHKGRNKYNINNNLINYIYKNYTKEK